MVYLESPEPEAMSCSEETSWESSWVVVSLSSA